MDDDEGAPPTTTRYCALCGQCEVCMTRLEEECWENERGEHVWNATEAHRVEQTSAVASGMRPVEDQEAARAAHRVLQQSIAEELEANERARRMPGVIG